MANINYIVDSSYEPLSMQEMMLPFAMYKDAYDKQEEKYIDLIDKADKFKYLSEVLPENSRARQIYEGYANELSAAAEDFGSRGLNAGSRSTFFNLRKRYQGEIGRLADADERMREVMKARTALQAQGIPMIYANDNLTIDDFLDGKSSGMYGINSEELYKKGAELGKAMSSRYYSSGDGGSVLGGYYRQWKETVGISPENIGSFMNSGPVQAASDAFMAQMGVADNLRPGTAAYARARQSFLNGIYNGIVYTEKNTPHEDKGVLSASTVLDLKTKGFDVDDKGRLLSYNYYPDRDVQSVREGYRQLTGIEKDPNSSTSSGSKSKSGSGAGSGEENGSYGPASAIPRPLRSRKDLDENAKNYMAALTRGYIGDRNGRIVISDQGIAALKSASKGNYTISKGNQAYPTVTGGGLQNGNVSVDSFYNSLVKLNGGKQIFNTDGSWANGMNINKLNDLVSKYAANGTGGMYDAWQEAEYMINLASTEQSSWGDAIMGQNQDYYNKVEFSETGFKPELIKRKELAGFKPVNIGISKYGITASVISDDNKEVKRIQVPVGVNPRAYSNAVKAANVADVYSQVLHERKVPEISNGSIKLNDKGRVVFTNTPLTQEQWAIYKDSYEKELAAMYGIAGSMVTTSKAKPVEYEATNYDDVEDFQN